MQTLEDVTAAHSRRISELQQRRDAALRAALGIRDTDLRALPAAAQLFQRFDKASAVADDDRAEVELKVAVITAEARRDEENAFKWFREQLETNVSRRRSS